MDVMETPVSLLVQAYDEEGRADRVQKALKELQKKEV